MIAAPISASGFEVAKRYATGKSATYTHPVFTPGGVLVRDATHLRLWTW